MNGHPAAIRRAREQLSEGDWTGARESFENAAAHDRSPEALFGLGTAAWWLGDTEAALSGWEGSYAAAIAREDWERALLSAVYLCLGYEMSLGNEAAAAAWVDRAEELVTRQHLEPFTGWILLCRAHLANDHGRPGAESWAREAVERSRSARDVDLELCATAELGTALVEDGRFDEGLRLLGTAMARALAGEANDLDAVVLIGCRVVTSCSRASDPKRALQWVRAADDFHDRYGSSHLFTTCRVHFGALLLTTGAWEDAERELLAALEIGRRAEPTLHAEATAKLAELRLAQGRIDDAERLLRGLESESAATFAVAALLLARGEPNAAASLVERRLGRLRDGCLEAWRLSELLGEIDVARGGFSDAAARAKAAVAQARAALHAFEAIGAVRDADEAAELIRSLGARARRGGPTVDGMLTRREREVAMLVAAGLRNPEIADRLFITRKTVEHHVSSILTKLGFSGRAELAAYAARTLSDPAQT